MLLHTNHWYIMAKTYAKAVKYDFLHILDQIVRVEKLLIF